MTAANDSSNTKALLASFFYLLFVYCMAPNQELAAQA
jgi:hypothetical protein